MPLLLVCSHEFVVVAVQLQLLPTVTLKLPLVAAAVGEMLVGERV